MAIPLGVVRVDLAPAALCVTGLPAHLSGIAADEVPLTLLALLDPERSVFGMVRPEDAVHLLGRQLAGRCRELEGLAVDENRGFPWGGRDELGG